MQAFLRESTEKIMPVLDTISINVSSLVEHIDVSPPKEQRSVRPKKKKEVDESIAAGGEDISSNSVDKEEPEVVEPVDKEEPEVVEPEIIEVKKRKGIFFSGSIGLQCNIQILSNSLNSRICTVKTYHIEKHDNARDPELYLKKNVSILDESSDIDFIILSLGTNDITKLNIEEDIGIVNDVAC